MSFFVKAAAGIGGSLLVVIALVIALLKGMIALIGFITTAVKFIVILAFVAVFVAVALMVYRAFREKKKSAD